MISLNLQHRVVLIICEASVNTCLPLKISNVDIDNNFVLSCGLKGHMRLKVIRISIYYNII